MPKSKPEPSRGILNKREGSMHFQITRYHPSAKLAFFVEHFWIVRWDLRGKEPYRQDVLSHPSVHLVFERKNSRIWSIVTGRFTRVLENKGHVLGIKFRPGAFYPFLRKPVASIMDKTLPFQEVFNENAESLESEILGHEIDKKMVERAENFLVRHLPDRDPRTEEAGRIVEFIMHNPSVMKVADLVEEFGITKRTLQRLFRKYIGINPKWVIRRYRLHEATERLADSHDEDWVSLALDLGYYDQAHFIRDFKAIVGKTPSEYRLL